MDEEFGWGSGSVMLMALVAAVVFFLPLIMGPVEAPGFWIIIIPVVLVAIWIILSETSK